MRFFFTSNNTLASLFAPIVCAMILQGCTNQDSDLVGSGKVVSEERGVKDFSRLSLSGNGNIFILQDDHESVKVEGEDNIIKLVKTKVLGETLQISFDETSLKNNIKPTQPLNIYIRIHDLREIRLSGSGTISSPYLHFDQLKVSISGSGNVDLKVQGKKIVSILSGNGQFSLSGEVKTQEIWISGSGVYEAPLLKSDFANIKLNGMGKVVVNVDEFMDVGISGAGVVHFLGNPKVNKTISGSGKVEPSIIK